MPAPARWGPVNQLFHWISACLLIAIAAIGLYMDGMPRGATRADLFGLHQSLGLTLLAVVVLRLLWRCAGPAPGPAAGMPRSLHRSAAIVHWSLYALMLAMPLTGWLAASTGGGTLQWFALFDVPGLAAPDEDLHDLAEEVHEAGFWILAALATGHVFAALYHHVFLGDGTLHRMLPARRGDPRD